MIVYFESSTLVTLDHFTLLARHVLWRVVHFKCPMSNTNVNLEQRVISKRMGERATGFKRVLFIQTGSCTGIPVVNFYNHNRQ